MLSLAVLAAAGCTRSLDVKYAGGFDQASGVKTTSLKKVAILPFNDERAWVDKADEQSRSYIAKQGVWKFGLTFEGKEYTPVSGLLQTLFVSEFKAAGYDAVASASPSSDVAYNLSGRVVNFEFENETGLVTVTSRRVVTLALSLTDSTGKSVLDNQLFSENDRENEGMGVMHSTNADKLMNRALKKVVTDVLIRLKPQLASRDNIDFRVTLNGIALHQDSYGAYQLAHNIR
ncbi:MAG TPA: hypothetical protein VK165_17685 [Azonexus sp.]|nr:hypothetical protein [Azonexus sp.]